VRLLIAHDGSESSDAVIDDLARAGLAQTGQAVVMSVAVIPALAVDVSVTACPCYFDGGNPDLSAGPTHELQAAQSHAAAAGRLRAAFPRWIVSTDARVNSAAGYIVGKSHSWQPDLLVVGARGCSASNRRALGSVAQAVLSHAACSVRIARPPLHSQATSPRLLVGVDGSPHSRAAVQSILARAWPAGTEVRVVGVIQVPPDPHGPDLSKPHAHAPADYSEVRARICRAVTEAGNALSAPSTLSAARLAVSTAVREGRPARQLLFEAEQWQANCIFLGAHGAGGTRSQPLGKVAFDIAADAPCSVEVVRR
jgi:nucleotide-binding universal stress UspA family protein